MTDSAKTDGRVAGDAAQAERSERLPWIAPRMDTFEVGDTAAASPRTPGTDGSFTLS
jgi:hypothetical protein